MELSELLVGIGGIATFATFCTGLFQYHRAQRWRSVEFIAKEFKEFAADPPVKNALAMLEQQWDEVDLAGGCGNGGPAQPVTIDDATVANALRCPGSRWSDVDRAIQACFDKLFAGLELFNDYVESGLIKRRDLHIYLGYYLGLMNGDRAGRGSAAFTAAVERYIGYHRYVGVARLLDGYRSYQPCGGWCSRLSPKRLVALRPQHGAA